MGSCGRRGRRECGCCRCSCRRTGCRRRGWRAAPCWRLDADVHRRTYFEETDRCVDVLRRLISVESEVIQCAEANRVSVLILRKSLAVPRDGTAGLSYTPRRAAVTLVIECAVVSPARFLRRCVKANVTDVRFWSNRKTEGLDATIEVLVIQGILVMPDTG